MLKSTQVEEFLRLIALLAPGLLLPLFSQEAWMNDREVMQELRSEGIRYDRDSATLYFEKDALTADEMDRFSNLANQGIKDIEGLLKVPPERRREQSGKIFYFVSSRIDIGRSRFRTVML